MNKVGIYYAFWTNDWDADFLPFVGKVKRLGFDVLEVNAGTIATMSAGDRATLRKAAADAGIGLGYCIGLTKKHDLASPEKSVRDAGMAFMKRMCGAIGEMGGGTLGGIIYGSWPGKLPSGADRRQLSDHSVASMKQVTTAAADANVDLCVEVVNRFEQYIMNTSAEAVEYVRRVDHPRCKVLLDTFHMNIEEDSFSGAIETAGKLLGHIHLGETNRRAPGRGRLPWDEFFGALKKVGYAGPVSMEPFLMPGGQVGRDISVYRDLRDGLDLDEEARRACAFVKGKLA